MRFFNLPDLGEGIPEADIVEWHIKEGDNIKEDDIMVSVETAKAIVDVPAPCTGIIAKLCAQPGETVLTGAPLVEFVSDEADTGTVVGKLAEGDSSTVQDDFFIGAAPEPAALKSTALESTALKSTALSTSAGNIQALAQQLNMNLGDLPKGRSQTSPEKSYQLENPEPLKGVRKHMARTMAESHASVVPVTLFDDADIHHWSDKEDITVRLIQAIVHACKEEPALNAWFDGAALNREVHPSVALGLAVDSEDGLFVPVIRDADNLSGKQLRSKINDLRVAVKERTLPNSALQGASISLSNFGVFAGKYATPVVVPPMVCIIGVGKLKDEIVSVDGKPESHRILPLSLSFDHRAATGGEATRFLHAMIQLLQK